MKLLFAALTAATLILFYQPVAAQLSPQQKKDLTAFTRLYGYTRFFHPSDEAADLDWNAFAIYGARKVVEAKDDKELIGILQELFYPIAPTILIYPEAEKHAFSIAAITPPDTSNYKTTAWQHLGIGLTPQSIYKSIRINRSIQEAPGTQGFAPIAQSFPADVLKGKEFRFSGWMKVDPSMGGSGYFWMRIQKKGQVVYFYNMNNRPVTSNTWKEYSFTGEANKDADTVVLGAFLNGKGSLLMDNIQLAVKEGGSWKNIPLDNAGFENTASKTWHYNPRLSGYRFATVTEGAYEGSRAMSITSIKDSGRRSGSPAKPLFDQYPRPGEYIQPTLAPGVACIIPLALYGTKEQTYPEGDPAALAHLERNLHDAVPSAGVNGDSLAVRLGDIVISWNIFRHFFPYWEDAAATPEQLLDKAFSKAVTDKDRYEFLQTLQLMTSPLNDGHIFVSMQGDTQHVNFPPITIAKAEGRIVIDEVLDSTLRSSVAAGDIVRAIDGTPADVYMAALSKLFSGSPQFVTNRILLQAILGPKDSYLNLTLERDGNSHNVSLKRMNFWSKSYEASSATKHPSGWIKPGIFYIDLDRDPMDSIRGWMPKLEQARVIICDLRGYPNTNNELINHLLPQTEDTKWMFVPQVTYPDYKNVSFQSFGWNIHPMNPRLNGKVFFLTDGRAISYAESYMGFIKDFHLATIVGQPTAGTNGNINPYTLPGGYHISWTGMLVKDHQGGKHHLKGILPDVAVDRTIKGIREGRDEVLDKALDLAAKQ